MDLHFSAKTVTPASSFQVPLMRRAIGTASCRLLSGQCFAPGQHVAAAMIMYVKPR